MKLNISRIMQGTQRFDENMHIKIHRSEASLHINNYFLKACGYSLQNNFRQLTFFFVELAKAKRSLQITLSVRLFQQFAKHLCTTPYSKEWDIITRLVGREFSV